MSASKCDDRLWVAKRGACARAIMLRIIVDDEQNSLGTWEIGKHGVRAQPRPPKPPPMGTEVLTTMFYVFDNIHYPVCLVPAPKHMLRPAQPKVPFLELPLAGPRG